MSKASEIEVARLIGELEGTANAKIDERDRQIAELESRNRDMQNRVDHYLNYAKRIEKENKAWEEAARRRVLYSHSNACFESMYEYSSPCTCGHDALAALIKEKDDE